MAHTFLKANDGIILTVGQPLAFDFHGQSLKLVVTGLSTVDLPGNQSRGGASEMSGVVMLKTDVNVVKSGSSKIKIKSSAKKYVPTFVFCFVANLSQGSAKCHFGTQLQVRGYGNRGSRFRV